MGFLDGSLMATKLANSIAGAVYFGLQESRA
jgi:hypothetical protein